MSKTKLFFLTTIILSATIIFFSCKKKKDDPIPVPVGIPTAVGTLVGFSNSLSIDASGGTITSVDGRLEIIIPANALSAATNISIQPITNQTPAGAGVAYRLTPDGQQFSQPVTLRFHYDTTDVLGTDIHALGIAFQKSDNIWYSFIHKQLDSSAGTLSISTTHFTDWSLYKDIEILPFRQSIPVNTNLSLKVMRVDTTDASDDLMALGVQREYEDRSRLTWTANGVKGGFFSDGFVYPPDNSISTIYTSPGDVTAISENPVLVTAEVSIPGASKYFATSHVKVLNGGYHVDVVLKCTALFMNYCYVNYTDHADFMVTMNDDNSIASVSSLNNVAGHIDTIIQFPPCISTPLNNGNLLQINSVDALPQQDKLTLILYSNFITPDLSVNCNGSGAWTQVSVTDPRTYYMPEFDLDGNAYVIEFEASPTEKVIVTVTPQ